MAAAGVESGTNTRIDWTRNHKQVAVVWSGGITSVYGDEELAIGASLESSRPKRKVMPEI